MQDILWYVGVIGVSIGVGIVIYTLIQSARKSKPIKYDAADAGILAAGMQDPMLGVAAYTAGKAKTEKKEDDQPLQK